jgi:adenylate cyclase class 2
MQEIEAKFYVRDLEKIRRRLQELEALLIQERVLEMNIRFDLPDGGLGSEGRVLRLRQDTDAKLTYKGGSTNEQGVLSRNEIEFVVEDFEKAKAFLEALGYQSIFYYEKYRTTYEIRQTSEAPKNGETSEVSAHIMLDELPYGNFVEIEGETPESIQAVADLLNLQWDKATPTSYHMLFVRLCEKHPELDPKPLSFAALTGMNISVEELAVHAGDG